MSTVKDRRYSIVGGPNRDTLFDNCKYSCQGNSRVGVGFSIPFDIPSDSGPQIYTYMLVKDLKIRGIEHENGSGESFNLWGFCQADLYDIGVFEEYRFKAYYNSRKRQGWISFSD